MMDLAQNECIPRAERQIVQLERLKALVARLSERVPLYSERLSAVGVKPGDVRSLADLARLPFTVKDEFRQTYPYGLLAVPMEDVIRVHASSGTTGRPTVVAYSRKD